MLDALALSWLLLPLGAALGWYLAQRGRAGTPTGRGAPGGGAPEYLSGLTHLVNEDPDQAIAALVRAVEVDPSTVELHLTLGSLFRKRGEVDRALRLHENLLARPNLTPAQMHQARYELALDYLKAGVMDRAESILEELVAQGQFLPGSLEQLLAIHEQAREWDKAIETSRRLEPVKRQSLRPLIAQYACEQAEEARLRKDAPAAIKLASRALSEDPQCVRASLLQGALYEAAQDYNAALRAYRRVPEQDSRFLGEVLAGIERCFAAQQNRAGLRLFLEEAEERWPHPGPMLLTARLMLADGHDPTVYLAQRLQKLPNWQGLDLLFESLARQSEALAPTINGLRGALRKTYESTAPYQCTHCGLTPRLLFWQCPSCKQWASVVPVQGLLKAS